ncbi:transposase [Pedobacter sp. BS3]|nr:transposase [Pedobacter sp. BS3]
MRLFENNSFKIPVLDSLSYLSRMAKIDVFGFVIMPNHIHLIWRMNALNGKESAHGSFLKYTAHQFKKLMQKEKMNMHPYLVNASNKQYEFWQKDSLAVELYSREVAFQKLDYIHNNPLAAHWNLVTHPCDYEYSSASFYELGENKHTFLKDLRFEF